MKIVWEMYGNAYKSVCLKLCSGGGLRTIIVRNGRRWGWLAIMVRNGRR